MTHKLLESTPDVLSQEDIDLYHQLVKSQSIDQLAPEEQLHVLIVLNKKLKYFNTLVHEAT